MCINPKTINNEWEEIMNWLLVIVLLILIGNALIGRKVGFIKIVFSLVSMIIALVLTVWISPMVNDLLRNNEKIYGGITERVEKVLPFEEEETKVTDQIKYINELPLPETIKNTLIENNNVDVYKALAIDSFKDYVSSYFASIVINAMAFIGTFLIILILLWVLSTVLDIISKLPILNQINKTAGLVAGLVQGLIVVWLLFILLTVFGGSEFGKNALVMINESEILSIIYNNNMLLGFITSATKLFF